jgi:hypothetical protein
LLKIVQQFEAEFRKVYLEDDFLNLRIKSKLFGLISVDKPPSSEKNSFSENLQKKFLYHGMLS